MWNRSKSKCHPLLSLGAKYSMPSSHHSSAYEPTSLVYLTACYHY
jgi:hypothetical protein